MKNRHEYHNFHIRKTSSTTDEGQSSLQDNNNNNLRQDSIIIGAENDQSENGRHNMHSIRRGNIQHGEVVRDEGQLESRIMKRSYDKYSSTTTTTPALRGTSHFNNVNYPIRSLRNRNVQQSVKSNHYFEPSVSHNHNNNKKPNRLPPGAPGQISSACLLIPVFIAVWWYWTRKVHSIFLLLLA